MDHGPFFSLQKQKVAEGQRMLAATSRALLRRFESHLQQVLSGASDSAVLEPLLFAYFTALKSGKSPVGIAQLLLGYMDPASWPEVIEVHTDSRGRIYLPRIGYFLTHVRDRRLTLRCHGAGRRFTLEDAGSPVEFSFEEIQLLPGTSIELCRYGNPLYGSLLSEAAQKQRTVEFVEDTSPYVGNIRLALAVIEQHLPDFYADLCSTVRQIVLFRSRDLNSCATLGAHGVAFLNVVDYGNEVFFIDDLVHQCGHVIFNAFTAKRTDFCATDPETPFSRFSSNKSDKRSLYTVLHGAYTEFAMIACLLSCDNQRVFSGQSGYELIGRLACIFQRSLGDMKNLGHPGLFTEQGQNLYDTFRRFSEEVRESRPDLLDYKLTNQPYNFSYELFLELNPQGGRPSALTA